MRTRYYSGSGEKTRTTSGAAEASHSRMTRSSLTFFAMTLAMLLVCGDPAAVAQNNPAADKGETGYAGSRVSIGARSS